MVINSTLYLLRNYNVVSEYRFCKRRWRFDYAIPDKKIAIEIEGGVWISGRHNRASGFLKDMEKYNTATILGWRVLRFTPEEFANGEAFKYIKELL